MVWKGVVRLVEDDLVRLTGQYYWKMNVQLTMLLILFKFIREIGALCTFKVWYCFRKLVVTSSLVCFVSLLNLFGFFLWFFGVSLACGLGFTVMGFGVFVLSDVFSFFQVRAEFFTSMCLGFRLLCDCVLDFCLPMSKPCLVYFSLAKVRLCWVLC